MNREELIEKLKMGEVPAELDSLLQESEQERIASLVKGLPREEPSLVWRSKLNERIASEAKRKRSRWGGLLPGIVPAAGVAGILMLLILSSLLPGTQPQSGAITTEMLFDWHEEAVASTFLPEDGTGLSGFSADPVPFEPGEVDDLLYGDPLYSL